MAQLTGVAYIVQTKTPAQPKWLIEDEFVEDLATGYTASDAQQDAQVAFDAAVAGHTGGSREYRVLRCEEIRYETR